MNETHELKYAKETKHMVVYQETGVHADRCFGSIYINKKAFRSIHPLYIQVTAKSKEFDDESK